MKKVWFLFLGVAIILFGCKQSGGKDEPLANPKNQSSPQPVDVEIPEGMVWIPGGMFQQGVIAEDSPGDRS